jgi:glycerophosphoryl diester phosphodiesterase
VTVLAIAHRAGNSLAGLHTANVLGADVIEADVHQHRGRLEVRHLKTAGPLPFLWDKWELVSASKPRLGLEELLEADRHGTTFMLDMKGRRVSSARSAARLLHERGHHLPVVVCSRYWPAVDTMAAQLPFVRSVLSARTRPELSRLLTRLASSPAGSTYGVSVHCSLLDEPVVARLRSQVEVVMTWPVNDFYRLDAMLACGVNGIISDEPDVLADVVKRRD